MARDAAFVAGHSLGEYSALAAAGALSIADAARLLRIRGRAMQKAVPVGAGAMAALVGVEFADAEAIAAEAAGAGVCAAANDNGGGQVVLSGEKHGGRARRRNRQGARRQAGDDAAGIRSLPLRPDAAGRRRDGRGAGESRGQAAARAAGRQRSGAADQ